MTVPVVAVALLFWVCVFMVYFVSAQTTPLEFFLGRYEDPPASLGMWQQVGIEQDGLVREERYLLPGGRANAGSLVRQARCRNPTTGAIVRVEPEQRVRRRRVGRGGR
jgi:hypothetical protein